MPSSPRKAAAKKRAPVRKRIKHISAAGIRKANRHKKPSGLEKTLMDWFDQDGIKYKTEFPIGTNPVCHADFLLGKRTVIEAHGCFWHGCRICEHKLDPWQLTRHKKDGARYDFFIKQGYDVVVIWEHEVDKEPNRVRAMLRAIAENKGK